MLDIFKLLGQIKKNINGARFRRAEAIGGVILHLALNAGTHGLYTEGGTVGKGSQSGTAHENTLHIRNLPLAERKKRAFSSTDSFAGAKIRMALMYSAFKRKVKKALMNEL